MKKTRKAMMISMAMLVTLSLPMVALAETTVIPADSGSHTFSNKWIESKTVKVDGAECVLTYGFDKILINEDFAYAYTNGAIHRSRIKNDNGLHNGPWKVANEYSDLEVTHKGNSINYYQTWQ